YNQYGPTESHIVTAQELRGDPARWPLFPPIGRPISNTQLYVLDQQFEPLPIGVAGALYIGGVNLARGYLHRPEWTAERFVPNPWSLEPGARLYQTGDLARYRADGTIEYLGRADQQVKLRGYRIEPGEIETVLQAYPAIREAVVVLREETEGEKSLVAYLVAHPHEPLSNQAVRAYLQEHLPVYMLPSALVMLEALPLTPSGKVDRRALPAPQTIPEEAETGRFQEARTPLEELVQELWGQLLGQQQIGLSENFFERGGHSLLATQLIAQVRSLYAVEIPLRTIFEAPTVAEFARRVEQALRHDEVLAVPPLLVGPRPEALPLSYAQQRLWFLDQLEPGSMAYLLPSALRVTGALVVQALECSMDSLIERHESLRTTFADPGIGEPVQVIEPIGHVHLPLIDLQGLSQERQEEEVRRLVRQEAQHPCDLVRGPLLRLAIVRLQRDEHVLLITLHHIITDGWSIGIFVRELSALYRAYVAGEPSPLAPLMMQYADYALWQRQWLQGAVLEAQLDYWRQQLASNTPLDLPTDYPRPAVQMYRGAHLQWQIPLELTEALRTLSQQQHVTLFMTLLASFQVLLQRYSGQHDISVGTPIANRRQTEIEGLIGFFVNTLVLRSDLSGDPSFVELLQRVREVCLGAYAHQDVPFEQVVEALATERDLSRSPLFQVMFVLQNVPQEEPVEVTGVQLRPLSAENYSSQFDLALTITETEQGLRGSLQYNTDLFAAETMKRLLSHWQRLLEGVLQDTWRPIGSLPLLSAHEQAYILQQGKPIHRVASPSLSILQLIELQVERAPDAIAVVFAEQMLTYAELNRRANQLAHALRALGVGSEQRVGVCLERSLELVIGLLAIWKAGGVYVPLDPDYPAARHTFLLEDAQVQILLTREQVRPTIPAWEGQTLYLEREWDAISRFPTHEPERVELPLSLAYIIYTSGSTGQPKGTMIPHSGLGDVMIASARAFGLGPQTRLLQQASISFDNALWEMGMALVSGATLCLGRQETQVGEALAQLLQQQAITAAVLTPSVLATVPPATYPILQTLLVGGERCPAALAQRWSAGRRFFNTYGPTETTIHATYQECTDVSEQAPLIGRPNAHCETYLLDASLQPVPPGVVGELYIGGSGVARGYVQRPTLTAERFVPHPFSEQPGARLYRTGDLARTVPSGEIAFVGRVDQQVKIHGVRIELGEIEAVLRTHPGVREEVVVVREEREGEKRLVAYLVAHPEQPLSSLTVRAYLQERLPVHMLPSALVMLEALPLTPNGKVDRRALPAPEAIQDTDSSRFQEARTPLEELLRGLWCQLLDRQQIGLAENFFELGGHSLLATQLVAQVRSLYAVEIPLRTVFEAPTVAEFARRVEQALRRNDGMVAPPLTGGTRPEVLPLSYAQQRLWFLDQLEPGSTAYLVPAAFHIKGEMHIHALQRSLQELLQRHESLRTTFVDHSVGEPVQVIHPTGHVSLPLIDLQGLEPVRREKEARRLASQEAQQPSDLVYGPLLRCVLLRYGPEEHALLLTLHHIITDGWSGEIMQRELSTLYRAYATGEPSPLAPLKVQYADYALWQRQWLQGAVLEAQLNYWRQQLAGSAPLELPTDHPRPAVQTYRGASQEWQVPAALTEALRALSQQQHVTLFMTLLASFQVLLQHYSGQHDISVGTPIANRQQAEIEGLIGFFVNTLVLRSDLSGDPSFVEVLQRIREVCLGAYAHQDVPFEQVVEALEPERDLSRSPLFQVMFALQNVPQEEPAEVAGVQMRALSVENHTSQFDLTFTIAETPRGLYGALEYSTDLFEAATITRLLGHWQTLMEALLHEPHLPISQVPWLSEQELAHLLTHWNATQTAYPRDLCVHQRFEQQAQRTPDAVALVFEEQTLTYAELDRRANQLAHFLQTQGLSPDGLVALFLERTIEMVIAIFGVLKAGGAYVPFDVSTPIDRLSMLLQEVNPLVILTQTSLQQVITPLQRPMLCLDSADTLWQEPVTELALPGVFPEQAAYVIYTSGSTGQPKGVVLQHAGLLNHALSAIEHYALSEHDRVLQFSSLSFDIAVEEIFPILLCGGTLVLRTEEMLAPATAFLQAIDRWQITVLDLPTAYWHTLVASLIQEPVRLSETLRLLIVGGEKASPELYQHWTRLSGSHLRWLNTYGPTEATVIATLFDPQKALSHQPHLLPIGRPIANTQVYLLDRWLRPVPVGVRGEIFIGGAGIARGYLGSPDLTAERFLPDPFGSEPGARLYRTGDLATYLPGGELVFAGRLDEQVKIRGYRIEPGEIEAVLATHPAIREAMVLAREDWPGSRQLVAYVVTRTEQPLTSHDLRFYLQERLPAYLLPAAYVFLPTFPLTAHGKVDRRALPSPSWESAQDSEPFQAPRTPIEQTLAEIWAQVLHTQHIGLHENFFERGGDSILGIQIIARARQKHLPLTLKQLFQHQTIAELSAVIDDGELVQAEQGLVLGDAPLTPIQHWFFEQEMAEPQHWNQTLFLEVATPLQTGWLEEAVAAWLAQHDALRLRFRVDAEGWHQLFAPAEEPTPFACIDLSQLTSEQEEIQVRQLAAQTQTSLDLVNGPLARVLVFTREPARPQLLLMVIHHLAVDGVSWRILLEDLQQAYQQRASGLPIHLPAKTSSFKDWAERLVAYANSSEIEAEQGYWLTSQRAQVPHLPLDIPLSKQVNTVATTRACHAELTVQETSLLLEQVPSVYQTQINEILLTAVAQALAPWIGSSSILLELEGHGREALFADVDLSRTVGWFTTVFPVCLEPGQTSSVPETIAAVKAQVRAIPRHGIGYGLLRYLSTDPRARQLSSSPLAEPEISFNYLGQFHEEQFSSLLAGPSPFSAGPAQSARGRRTHLLDITAQVSAKRFQVTWSYCDQLHQRSTIERLMQAFMEALRAIIAQSQEPDAGTYTPAAFANVDLSQEQLDQIVLEMENAMEMDNDE
ncbi:MAG TPA: amino acid adenylation domain-containing protein, partial [Ktedonobacteraceae bacterium]|nr:amino acid adenylation domain-containing protein [Ktedonobacteraceae bacterium]